jgi:hypothetical protein
MLSNAAPRTVHLRGTSFHGCWMSFSLDCRPLPRCIVLAVRQIPRRRNFSFRDVGEARRMPIKAPCWSTVVGGSSVICSARWSHLRNPNAKGSQAAGKSINSG